MEWRCAWCANWLGGRKSRSTGGLRGKDVNAEVPGCVRRNGSETGRARRPARRAPDLAPHFSMSFITGPRRPCRRCTSRLISSPPPRSLRNVLTNALVQGRAQGGASRKAALRAGTAEVGAPPTGPLSLSAATPLAHIPVSRAARHTPPRRRAAHALVSLPPWRPPPPRPPVRTPSTSAP